VAGNPRIDELRKKLDKEPGSRLFAQLAEELRKDGDLEDAIRVAREGLQKHSSYPSARMTLGRALYDTGDWAAARAEFELVLKGAPDNILASRLLAESLESLGDVPAAIERYKKTLALAPGDKQVLSRLDALEGGGAAGSTAAAGTPAAAPASPAPIRVVEVDTPMELEQTHERATAFAAGPAAPPPGASAAAAETPAAPPPAGASPPPIPVAVADDDFELERPYEAPRPAPASAPAQESRPAVAAPAPARPAAESMMEFDFDAGPTGSTIPFAPPPAPAPPTAESAAAAPTIAEPPAPPPAPVPVPIPVAAPPPPTAFVPEPPPERPAHAPAPPPAEPAPAASDDLTSATLAELYFKQGFTEKAVEVYRQLVEREPENDRLTRRLAELLDARPAPAADVDFASAPAANMVGAAAGTDRAARRLALERTIAKLEGMLSAIKKG
jgi:Flp pilus assembly protein TadD